MKFYHFIILLVVCALVGAPTFDYDVSLSVIPALIGAAGILGGASLLGGALSNYSNSRSVDAANAANKEIAQMNNAFARQERLETQQWNRDMWYEQQEYNSPAAQAARLRVAGFNPANVGVDSGSISSMPQSQPMSPSSVAPMQAAHYENIAKDLPNLLGMFTSSELSHEQAKGQAINNQTALQENMSRIDNTIADTLSKLSNSKLSSQQRINLDDQLKTSKIQRAQMQLDYDRQFRDSQYDDRRWQSYFRQLDDAHQYSSAQTAALRLQNTITEKYGIKLADSQLGKLQVEISEARAHIGLIQSQTNYTDKMAVHEVRKTAKTIAESIGIQQQNKHFESIVGDIEDQIRLSGSESRLQDNWLKKPFVRGLYGLKTYIPGLSLGLLK